MYLFAEFNDIYKPGKLRKFIDDLHSGKLHREFHYGPDPTSEEEKSEPKPSEPSSEHHDDHDIKSTENQVDEVDETPPDSTFVKLAPSDKRYTLIKNEL